MGVGVFAFIRNMRRCTRVFFAKQVLTAVLLLSLPATVWAQQFSFSAIIVEGNKRIESDTIRNYAGIETSTTVSAASLNSAYQALVSSGLFEDVELIPSGSQLVIRVQEFPTINRVAFEGNRALKDEELAKIVKSQVRRVFNPTTVEQDRLALAEAYANSGMLAARVSPKFIRQSDNRVDLVFEIFEGGKIEIERISFVGNRAFSDRKLRSVIESKQAGALRFLIQRDTFVEDRIEFDKQLLSDFYKSRGFVDFRVNSVNAQFSEERDGYFITLNLREGQQFKVASVSARSDLTEVDVDAFERAGRMKKGDIFSPLRIENDIARMERLANQEGLEFIRVTPDISRNDRALTLDVTYDIERGERIFIERIDISGNTATLDRVIRRQFKVVEGDPFNAREIRASARRIEALGFFSSSDVSARDGQRPDQKIIDVRVAEAPTGSLNFGLTYSSAVGPAGIVEYNERNFLGRGQALSLKFSAGADSQIFSFGFTEPAFLYNDLTFSFSGSYRATQKQFSSFDTSTLQLRPQFSFPLTDRSRLGLRYFYDATDITGLPASSGQALTQEGAQGRVTQSGLGYTLSYDSRRTGLNPSAGVFLQFGQDFSGLGGDATSIKSTARVAGETKVWGDEVTFLGVLEGGNLAYSKGKSRVTDRFKLGGNVMRGFDPDGIGPREYDAATGVNDALGADNFAVMRLEAQFPIGIPEEYGLSGAIFYDVGNLWGVDYNDVNIEYDSGSWRQTVGVSLFWQTPVGPFRFNFSRPLAKETLDTARQFELTLATRNF